MAPQDELISEPIVPDARTFDATAMARGEPGLPTGFTWRDRHYEIAELTRSWKASEAEGHKRGGERYYRKHFFRVRCRSGEIMTLYALRHMKRGENPRRRWWLYTIETK
ncbi:MAG: DUF6504 family protein [Phycisphaerae bacterium]